MVKIYTFIKRESINVYRGLSPYFDLLRSLHIIYSKSVFLLFWFKLSMFIDVLALFMANILCIYLPNLLQIYYLYTLF